MLAGALAGWPAYQNGRQIRSGLRAAELGAQLAFVQNEYHARYGKFAEDFSQLAPLVSEPIACALTQPPFTCLGYEYTLDQTHWLVASSQKDPQTYLAFDLESGFVDCSHAAQEVQRAPLCSPLD